MEYQTKPIFVYGTLRTGQHNHFLLTHFGIKTEEGSIKGQMYSHGPFPTVVLEGDQHIAGELVSINDPARYEELLTRLDGLEGVDPTTLTGPLYNRETVTVELTGGETVSAWVYTAPAVPRRLPKIESGDWLDHTPVVTQPTFLYSAV